MWPGLPADSGLDLLGHEILAEKAAALGRAGEKARGALARLKAAGVRLIDETARPGAHGSLVAFIHPASAHGVLVELKQTGP